MSWLAAFAIVLVFFWLRNFLGSMLSYATKGRISEEQGRHYVAFTWVTFLRCLWVIMILVMWKVGIIQAVSGWCWDIVYAFFHFFYMMLRFAFETILR